MGLFPLGGGEHNKKNIKNIISVKHPFVNGCADGRLSTLRKQVYARWQTPISSPAGPDFTEMRKPILNLNNNANPN